MTENIQDENIFLPPQAPASLTVPVYKHDGSTTGEQIDLDPRVFGLERNDHVLYLAVKTEMTNKRQGTRATKTRAEVSGGGKKPWKQKGRGGARAGSNRSPVWRHGGTIFGPKPIDFQMKLPHKVKVLARKVALSLKAYAGDIKVVADIEMAAPKTRTIADMLGALKMNSTSVLFLLNGNQPIVVKSCRNIPRVEVRDSITASTFDILKARQLVISRSALDSLVKGLVSEK